MVKIKKKTKDSLRKILSIIFVLFIIYLIYEIARKMLGGSLGFEALIIALLIANISFSFYLKGDIAKIDSKISKHIGWHQGKEKKE